MKEPIDLRGLNFEEGYIAVLDKPLRWTSTDVVRKIKSVSYTHLTLPTILLV